MMNVDLLQALSKFITEKIAPGVVAHGGQVEILSFEDNILKLGLSGACTTCSLDAMTKEGIADYVLDAFPDLDDCEVVDIMEENQESPLNIAAAVPKIEPK